MVAVLVGVALVVVQHARWTDFAAAQRSRLLAFKDVALWAARSTPPDAVFLGDPAYANGWREYSGRAYYGALAELAHYATLYDLAPGLLEKGLARVLEFGVDVRAVDPAAISLPNGGKYGISVLAPKVSASFNTMSADDLRAIARRHGVGYVIMRRIDHKKPLTSLRTVYSNAEFEVYAM